MKKMILVLIGLIIFASLGLAQETPKLLYSLAVDIYQPAPVEPLPPPPMESSPSLQQVVEATQNASAHGAAKTFSEHLSYCSAHREYSFQTKKWKNVPALSERKCNQLWSKFLSNHKIKFKTKDYGYTAK